MKEKLEKYLSSLKKLEEECWEELDECKNELGSNNPSTRTARARWGQVFEDMSRLENILKMYRD